MGRVQDSVGLTEYVVDGCNEYTGFLHDDIPVVETRLIEAYSLTNAIHIFRLTFPEFIHGYVSQVGAQGRCSWQADGDCIWTKGRITPTRTGVHAEGLK